MSARARHLTLTLLVLIGLAAAACSDSSSESSSSSSVPTTTAPTTETTTSPEWDRIDQALTDMGPDVGFLAARVAPEGTCEPIHALEVSTPRPIGSQFKLYVLGALAEQIDAGQVAWDQTLTVDDEVKSLGNTEESGSLQFAEPGTTVTVEEAATKMISISDNTATDLIMRLVGRDAIEKQVREWSSHASANEPFLTTRQMFQLHYAAGLADAYLATLQDERDAFLASSVDPRPLADAIAGLTVEPRYVDEIEWFGSPADLCDTFAGLQPLADEPPLSPTLSSVLSQEVGGIGLDPAEWPTVWFKGGSEPGVLALGWLATNADGKTFVVQAMVSNPEVALAPESTQALRDLAREVFPLLE